ncbi:MAG: 5'-methylthioadenosine/adenosylhomocysteine nucleosidase [Eubacterium sp.]|nr:5'-methylthioadenosine/adenosylhomocysteine nucleosidase [Eubacterium sp.]
MIGIIGAMDKEVNDLKSVMGGPGDSLTPKIEKHAGMDFCEGTLGGQDVVLVRSGIGKVNAAVAAEILVAVFNVKAIINTGIAGSLDANIDIGDIVLSTDSLEHDMNVKGLGYERGVVPDQEASIYPADAELRAVAKEACEKVCPDINVFEGRVVSGDIFVSEKAMKDKMVKDFGGTCTEMEGASIAHVAWLNQIPYLIIRSISDKADDSAEMDYPSFQKMAIENSVKLVTAMMNSMKKI